MLAEMLNVTDRAISKWENGICMPDSGIIRELCETLNITINDLFSGEIVDMKDNEKIYFVPKVKKSTYTYIESENK